MDRAQTEPDCLSFARADKANISGMLAIIHRCVLEINAADYTPHQVEKLLDGFTADWLENIIDTRHYYEVRYQGKLIACGGVSRDRRQRGQSYFTAVFVDPDFCGRGVGRELVEFLETDPWCLDSRLIEVPASKSAHGFYAKCGYRYREYPPVFRDGTTILYKEMGAPR